MDSLLIKGGNKLYGEIDISGSKNASLPIMIASLLTEDKVKLKNIPTLADVKTLIEILKSLGAEIKTSSDVIELRTKEIISNRASYDLVKKMRASFWVLAPLIARTGYAEVSLPGGCAIGTRPVDIYLKILKKMGVNISINDGYIIAKTEKALKGINFKLKKESVGCTHFFLMLSATANGVSHLSNAACEPEVQALGEMLNKMGAKIYGLGTNELTIKGVSKLDGISLKVPPDRIETGTFAIALGIVGGKITLRNTIHSENKLLLNLLSKSGILIKTKNNSIILEKNDTEIKPVNIDTRPYPGFPTDLQAQFMSLMTLSNGKSFIRENIFENRFMHVQELVRLGADIKLKGDKAIINGVKKIKGANVMATDLRASASLVIAALAATDITKISRIYHLDRGFYNLEEKLNNCGASIKRVKERNG